MDRERNALRFMPFVQTVNQLLSICFAADAPERKESSGRGRGQRILDFEGLIPNHLERMKMGFISSLGRAGYAYQRLITFISGFLVFHMTGSGHADELPAFTEHPASRDAYAGMNVLLSAQAQSAAPVSYQWLANGAPMSDQTNTVLPLFCVSLTQSGHVFSVVASNAAGAITSSPALLGVTIPDSGRVQQTWGYNPAAQFNGFSPVNHWTETGAIFNVDLFDAGIGRIWGSGIYTADSSLPAAAVHSGLLTAGQRGTVVVRIAPGQPSYSSSFANGITSIAWGSYGCSFEILGLAPTITRHPKHQARMIQAEARFAVEAFGTGMLRYQWKHNGFSLPDKTNAVLQLTVESENLAGCYAVTVTDDQGSTTSDYAMLGVVIPEVGSPQSAAFSPGAIPVGEFRRMVITGITNDNRVWGSGCFTIDSDLANAAVHDGMLAAGQTAVLSVVRLPEQQAFIGDDDNNISTRSFGHYPAFAFLGMVPQAIKDPVSQAVLSGSTCTLKVEAAYPNAFSYQWRKDGWPIIGATQPQLVAAADAPGSVARYDVLLKAPGNLNVTEPAFVFTPPSTSQVFIAASPGEAASYLGAAGNLVYLPLEGATEQTKLWGTGIYAIDSALASAAVHADRLAPAQTAQVGIYAVGTWPSFHGSTRNGWTSVDYGPFPGYVFLFAAPVVAPQPKLSMLGAGRLAISGEPGLACQIWASADLGPTAVWSLVGSLSLAGEFQT